jgi:protein gp37
MAKSPPATKSVAIIAPPKPTLLNQYDALELPEIHVGNGDLRPVEEKQLLKRCEETISANLGGFMAVGAALATIRARKLHRHAGFATFAEYCQERWDFGASRAYQLINASQVVENVHNCGQIDVLPANEAQVRPLLRLEPDQRIAAWKKVVRTSNGKTITAKLVESTVHKTAADPERSARFNKSNFNVDWAKWTWNPVTGCKHGCSYCYAREFAKRFPKRFGPNFKPHFHSERLAAPANTKIPEGLKNEPGIRNVFTCSMADLFGDWVKRKWIDDVLEVVHKSPQWNFLFLTKNPKRLVDIDWPKNAWVGTTVDRQDRVGPAIKAMAEVKATIRFLSCEPLLERLQFPTMACFDWVVIGARSGSGAEPEQQPEREWVHALMEQAWKANCNLYCKPNLKALIKEYPDDCPVK